MRSLSLELSAIAAAVASSSTASATNVDSTRRRHAITGAMNAAPKNHKRRATEHRSAPASERNMPGDSTRAKSLRHRVMEKAKPLARHRRRLENDDDAYYNQDDASGYAVTYDFDFDPTSYSISYHRCANVRQFDDSLATEEDSQAVFATKHLAMFRLCPADSCEEVTSYGYYYASQSSDGVFDRLRYSGANGGACQSNYGDYILELEDYLEIMTEYHSERFEKYCETCEGCLYDVYQSWVQDWQRHRDLKHISDPSWMDDLEGEAFRQQRELGSYDPTQICAEYNTCKSYKNVCNNGVDDTHIEYFTCTAVEGYDGSMYYIGPHCASNGLSLALGVFSDDGCNEYIGSSVSIEDVLGYEIDDDALFGPYVTGSLTKEIQQQQGSNANSTQDEPLCIPCMASRQVYETRNSANAYGDDDNGNVDDEYEDQYGKSSVSTICGTLYLSSAQCDKNIQRYNSNYNQWNAEAVAEEETTCEYIDAITNGHYDDMGFVLTNYSLDGYVPDSMLEQYGGALQDVTLPQIVALAVAMVACVALAAWGCVLRQKLRKKKNRRRKGGRKEALYIAPSTESDAALQSLNSNGTGVEMPLERRKSGNGKVDALQKEIEVLKSQLAAKNKRRASSDSPDTTYTCDDSADASSNYSSSYGTPSIYSATTEGLSVVSRTASEFTSRTGVSYQSVARASSDVGAKLSKAISSASKSMVGSVEKLPAVDESKPTTDFLPESSLPTDVDALQKDIIQMKEQLASGAKKSSARKDNQRDAAPTSDEGSVLNAALTTSSSLIDVATAMIFPLDAADSTNAMIRGNAPSHEASNNVKRKTTGANGVHPVVESRAPSPSDSAMFLPRATSLSANINALNQEMADMKKKLAAEKDGSVSADVKEGSSETLNKTKKKKKGGIRKMFQRKAK